MGAREYIGMGGLTLTLDDPLSPEMAKQVAAGNLRPVDGQPADVEAGNKSLVVVDGADADTVNRVGNHRRSPGEKPDENAHAGAWATYAVALGLNATQASTLSLTQLQEWVAAQEASSPAEEMQGAGHEASEAFTEGLGRPAKSASADKWRAYAVSLGMPQDEAATASKADLQDYAQVVEDAREQGE